MRAGLGKGLAGAALVVACLLAGTAGGEPLADPTAPPSGRAGGAGTALGPGALTWTRVTENRREAMINGTKVTEGQRLDDMQIERIRHGEVVVVTVDRSITLRLSPTGIKRPPMR